MLQRGWQWSEVLFAEKYLFRNPLIDASQQRALHLFKNYALVVGTGQVDVFLQQRGLLTKTVLFVEFLML